LKGVKRPPPFESTRPPYLGSGLAAGLGLGGHCSLELNGQLDVFDLHPLHLDAPVVRGVVQRGLRGREVDALLESFREPLLNTWLCSKLFPLTKQTILLFYICPAGGAPPQPITNAVSLVVLQCLRVHFTSMHQVKQQIGAFSQRRFVLPVLNDNQADCENITLKRSDATVCAARHRVYARGGVKTPQNDTQEAEHR